MSTDDPGFIDRWNERLQSSQQDMAITLGIEAVSASEEHVEMAMPFRPEIGQATGLFSAGALIQLADVAATLMCLRALQRRESDGVVYFPLAIQMNAQLIGNTNAGRAIARSTFLSAGRTVMAAQTLVRDEQVKDLLLLTSTYIVKAVRN
jgi:uncharacterized protein (TIGR00369 family)